jgi:hypothetical protein
VNPETIVRGVEVAGGLVAELARLVTGFMDRGHEEEEATRLALAELSKRPDLRPLLPRVRAMVAGARAEEP